VQETGAGAVFWNRHYEPLSVAFDTKLKAGLRADGIEAESFEGELLHEPTQVKTGAGGAFRVYSPFWRALEAGPEPRDPLPAPTSLKSWSGHVDGVSLESLALLPTTPDWAGGMRETWTPGEAGAQARLKNFLGEIVEGYAEGRDRPDLEGTSRLSPHLAHGEITPFQIFAAVRAAETSGSGTDREKFRKEVGWREFSYHLLFHNPELATRNFNPAFDAFPFAENGAMLDAWQRGCTGYPIVDAGMRQLWQTGWMHNRVRMIVASFLVKHLLIDWRDGEKWFWDTLVDADPASNPASWQWVAGSGADAAPYFRIFNPMLQGAKFDPDGRYVRHFVPELTKMPSAHIHIPWEAPAAVLREAGVKLGANYPVPVVNHQTARDRAMEAYGTMRGDQ
jgi:deoxyribodipyrimidine photo-lyase